MRLPTRSSPIRRPAAWTVFLFSVLLSGFSAAQPVNDHFANGTVITSIPAAVTGNLTGSTLEAGDPMQGRSIWWKFTPDASGTYYISLYPENTPYLRMYVYTGATLATAVKQTGQQMPNTPTYTRTEKFELTAGVEYSILIGSERDWDQFAVDLSITRNTAPSVTLTSPVQDGLHYHGNPLELRVNASDPDGTVVRVDYYFDTHYYEGSSVPVAFSTVPPFTATAIPPAGGSYYQNVFAIATDNDGAKTLSPSVRFLATYFTPQNFFADRKPIIGEKIYEPIDLRYATREVGEPQYGNQTVWWSWTAPSTKEFVLSSRGWPAGFSPRIDVYTGSSLGSLVSRASSADNGSGAHYTAQVFLNATAGQNYVIRLSSVLGLGGKTGLGITPRSPAGSPPQIESIRLTENGEVELMLLTNSVPLSDLQRSPDLKTWTPEFVPYPSNGYFKEVLRRPAAPAYFYRMAEKIPAP